MPSTDRQPYVDLYIGDYRISTSDYLMNFEVRRDIAGMEGTFQLFDPAWTNLEALTLERGVNTEIKFTYGWMEEQSNIIVARLMEYSPEFNEEGLWLNIEWAFASQMSARVKHSVSWSSRKKVSDIVREIAVKNSWEFDIEPTKGVFSQPIVQKSVSDFYFIRNVLAPRAVNRSGVGGYRVSFDNNKLIFRTVQNRGNRIYKSYVVNRQMDGEVVSFAPSDNVADFAQMGGRRVKIKSFDPINKKMIESDTSYQDTTSGLARDGRKISTVELQRDKGQDIKTIAKPFHTKEEINNYAKVKYAEFSQYNYKAEAVIMGDPFLPITGSVEFSIITPTGLLHYLSGVYKVDEVVDTVANGEFTSTLIVSRRAVTKGSEVLQGIKENLVKVPFRKSAIIKEVESE